MNTTKTPDRHATGPAAAALTAGSWAILSLNHAAEYAWIISAVLLAVAALVWLVGGYPGRVLTDRPGRD